MKNYFSVSALGLFFISLFFSVTIYSQENVLKGIDEYINEVGKKFEVPGISVAVVKDGKVVLAKGYGLKNLGGTEKIDENTTIWNCFQF